MSETKPYILNRDDSGRMRLIIQNELLAEPSKTLLQKAGLRNGMRVLEIASGVGLMSSYIAKTIAPQGELVATDISETQLEYAKQYCADNVNSNITFMRYDVLEDNPEWHNSFDLVYARLVLGHIIDPVRALKNMYSYLKPQGVLVSEESTHRESYCVPDSAEFNRVFELLEQLQNYYGYESQGKHLYQHFVNLGLANITTSFYQPELKTTQQKELILMGLRELESGLLKNNLTTKDELDKLKQELHHLAKHSSRIAYLAITQVVANK